MIVAELRALVRQRAGDRCEYCRLPQAALTWGTLQIEHVIAKQHGGDDDPTNLALACDRCNLYKGPNLSTIDPESGTVVPLFDPRQDDWPEHFAMVEGRIIGLTSIGRATVKLLNMNAETRVQLRRESSRADEEPT